jgi:hypothetical protein
MAQSLPYYWVREDDMETHIIGIIQLAVAAVFLLRRWRHAAADLCRLNVSEGIMTLEIC